MGQVAGRDGSASRRFGPRPEGNDPSILGPMLRVLRKVQKLTLQNLEGRAKRREELRRGRGREAGPGFPGSAEAGCVLAQHVRAGVGQAAGRAAEARGLVPPAPWPRPWPISTTLTWATSTTVREQGGTRGVSGRGSYEAGVLQLQRRVLTNSFPTPRGRAPYEAPSLGIDP